MTWWSWREVNTRSHPELGRENSQRRWYSVSRRGRVGRRQVFQSTHHPRLRAGTTVSAAGWSSPVARQAHNLKVAGSNPAPATKYFRSIGPRAAQPAFHKKTLSFQELMPIFAAYGCVRSHPDDRPTMRITKMKSRGQAAVMGGVRLSDQCPEEPS